MNTEDANLDRERTLLALAERVSTFSRDPSTKVGAVLTSEGRVADFAWNHIPFRLGGLSDDAYADREKKYGRVVHAEEILLLRNGSLPDLEMYVSCPPCERCALLVVAADVRRVCFLRATEDFRSRWSESANKALKILRRANVSFADYAASSVRDGIRNRAGDFPYDSVVRVLVEEEGA